MPNGAASEDAGSSIRDLLKLLTLVSPNANYFHF